MAMSMNINQRLLQSVREEPKKMLMPISGYENVTVKSLEDACEPIKNLFDQKLKQNINIAKMNSSDPEDNLTPDESAAIHLYTMEWDVHEKSLYMILNQTLRSADRSKLQPWFKYLKLFLTAFFKLPSSEYTLVWRGVREDLSALYPKGKEFAWWALSSCTTSIEVLESPNYLGKSGTRTIFSIQTNRGKSVRTHSYFENEDEVLLPPGIYLRVIGNMSPASDLHIIHLQEIAPPHQMLADPFDLSQLKHTLPTKSTTQVTPKKEQLPIDVPKKKSPYSEEKLDCNGRACAECGYCRDWCWRPDGSGGKNYTKRSDANCTGYRRDAYYYYRRDAYYYYHYGDGRYDDDRLCECDDNRS